MHLITPTLHCLRLLVAGNLAAASRESGLTFQSAIWPDDMEMREGLAVHLSACEQHPPDLLWRVFLIADGHNAVAGHAGFKGGPGRLGEVEIYWCVEPGWRGKGIAKAAAAALSRYAFDHAAVTAITATISRHNIVSQHVALALGMRPALREMKFGLPLWRLLREDWQSRSSALTDPIPVIASTQPAPG